MLRLGTRGTGFDFEDIFTCTPKCNDKYISSLCNLGFCLEISGLYRLGSKQSLLELLEIKLDMDWCSVVDDIVESWLE